MTEKAAEGRQRNVARRTELRNRLVLAAEQIIEIDGLSLLKARRLADAAGCALGAIYTAFADLDAVVMAVSAHTLARLDRHLAPILDASEEPRRKLSLLAQGYLDFAALHRALWRALFEHRLPDKRQVPQWLMDDQSRLFARVEEVLTPLTPSMPAPERALLARTLFSAVHGVVLLGLEEKLAPMPMPALRAQLAAIVDAVTTGIDAMA